jgi:hypothetical protein
MVAPVHNLDPTILPDQRSCDGGRGGGQGTESSIDFIYFWGVE